MIELGRTARTLYRPSFRSGVTSLRTARDGRIWLERSGPRGADETVWIVLAADGTPLAEVGLPDGFNLVVAGRDQVWGWETDDLDVPYVVRYRIEREGT